MRWNNYEAEWFISCLVCFQWFLVDWRTTSKRSRGVGDLFSLPAAPATMLGWRWVATDQMLFLLWCKCTKWKHICIAIHIESISLVGYVCVVDTGVRTVCWHVLCSELDWLVLTEWCWAVLCCFPRPARSWRSWPSCLSWWSWPATSWTGTLLSSETTSASSSVSQVGMLVPSGHDWVAHSPFVLQFPSLGATLVLPDLSLLALSLSANKL